MDDNELIAEELAALPPGDRAQVREFIAFLRWRSAQAVRGAAAASEPVWRFSFLESFASADVSATRDPAGMEVKTAEAMVGGLRRPALWQHPPVDGESVVEYHVPVPAGLKDVRLRFAVGIREGAGVAERLMAFRVRVNGWTIWSRAVWPTAWEQVELALPLQAGNVLRLAFATDSLGEHQFAWAVWGEPMLVGFGDRG